LVTKVTLFNPELAQPPPLAFPWSRRAKIPNVLRPSMSGRHAVLLCFQMLSKHLLNT
jgi:hypothetical protein